jgi:hypothetical protein
MVMVPKVSFPNAVAQFAPLSCVAEFWREARLKVF